MVPVQDQPVVLVGHDHIQDSPVPQVCQSHRPAVEGLLSSHLAGHIVEESIPGIDPDAILLVSRLASPFHGRPFPDIGDDRPVAAGHFGIIVPVTGTGLARYKSIGHIKVLVPIIVQVTELGTVAPASGFNPVLPGQVPVDQLPVSLLRDPEIVPLKQDAFLGDV